MAFQKYDAAFIEAALHGFAQQKQLIEQKMAELWQQLSRAKPESQDASASPGMRRKRIFSPEARQRIAAAQRRRWARARRQETAKSASR